jgi:hypothetical protein
MPPFKIIGVDRIEGFLGKAGESHLGRVGGIL